MDNQGAGFAFDGNMDFSSFTMPLQQQQPFMKPLEDNTSSFFGDEGIDTSASFMDPTIFTTPQTSFNMPQTFTMDNTSGSTAAWNTQLTPDLHNALTTFPSTPVQSFDALYQQPTALGKRSLQLDVHDFPQAKRHETADFTLFSPYPSTVTSSSWPLDTHSTPSSSLVGLSDEAADMCATWFNKYNVLPSDKHIDSLSQLTGEPAEAVRSWFGRLLKQGMGGSQSDSAYKSQTSLVQQHESFWDDSYSTDMIRTSPLDMSLQTEGTTSPEASSSQDANTTTQPAPAVRGSKKRCTPTEDAQLLSRDPNKIYQCTRKCGKRYGRKCDWKRNEEEGYPCKSWVCSLCTSEGVENVKPCYRKYHFVQHFRNIHPEVNAEEYDASSVVCSETEFPRRCGFCRHRFQSRQERIDHIADHFKQGKCMLDWNDDGPDDSHDSDNTDDDDDDRPSGNGFGGNQDFHPPPPRDPSDRSSKYYGGDHGGSSGGQPSNTGYFQFQLTQCNATSTEQHIKPTDNTQFNQQCSQLDEETRRPQQSSIHGPLQCSLQGPIQDSSAQHILTSPKQHITTTKDDEDPVAGNALARPIADQSQGKLQNQNNQVTWPGDHLASVLATKTGCQRLSSAMTSVVDDVQLQLSKSNLLELGEPTKSIVAASSTQATMPDHVLSAQMRDIKSPIALLESKVTPLRNKRVMEQRLISQQPLPSISVTSQSFLSVKLLGAGGFSTVDEVVHRDTNLRMGRKTLKNRNQTALEEIRKEVDVLRKLRHPHVIRFLGAYANGDKMSLLVSPVADTTLALWLERFTVHQPTHFAETIVKMFGCLASSVRYLHEQRPVVKHMDIKPQNILIVGGDQQFPHVVLCDFGISSADEMPDGQAKPVTRKYIAPEVCEGFARKQAADIWSLGCVFAEMASVPFSQSNSAWSSFRRAFNGRTGKHYWQDVLGLQGRLSSFLNEATTETEQTVVRALQSMLRAKPAERPDAATLTMIFSPAPCCLEWPNDNAIFPGPHEELGAVEMLAREDGIDCCTQQYHAKQSETETPLSCAKCWLDDCSQSHDACRHNMPVGMKELPTRLVDILPDGQAASYVRVIDSASIQPTSDEVNYIALSHLWNEDNITLTSDWLQEKSTELPLQKLPTAVNTAIATAQQLGHRYIWADSLCVLQDSEHDKQQECSAMATVYRNAALTMVLGQMAGDTQEENVSTQSTADLSAGYANTKRSSSPEDRRGASATLPAIDFTTPGFAWDTRAWALQERLLSRRFLHLGEQMYWECNALKASETFPRGLSPLVWEKVHSKPVVNTDRKSITLAINALDQAERQEHLPTSPSTYNMLWTEGKDNVVDDVAVTDASFPFAFAAISSVISGASHTEPIRSSPTWTHGLDNIDNVNHTTPPDLRHLESTIASNDSNTTTNTTTYNDKHRQCRSSSDSYGSNRTNGTWEAPHEAVLNDILMRKTNLMERMNRAVHRHGGGEGKSGPAA